MGAQVYFDTDAFRHIAATYQERSLPSDLHNKIVLSPITMFEVFSHLAEKCAESIFKQIQGLPNWIDKRDVHLLPWPDEQISHMLFGMPLQDDLFMQAVQEIVQNCLTGSRSDVIEPARELRDLARSIKEKRAINFQTLIDICRDDPSFNVEFSEEWLKCRVKQYTGIRQLEILEALSAYHEFDIEKLKVAIANADYNPQKHQNDVLDSEQLAYLCDPALHLITCDWGYLNKIRRSPQKNRIHQASPEILSHPDKAEALLRQIGS